MENLSVWIEKWLKMSASSKKQKAQTRKAERYMAKVDGKRGEGFDR